ncbi:MMK1 [Symbiodinium sp. KB8]|nr:MMK1 [Symbiodinium sp. KB8]
MAEVDNFRGGAVHESGKPQALHVEVRWMLTGGMACEVHATPSTRIAEIRAQVCQTTGVPPEQQRLFHEGKELSQQIDVSEMGHSYAGIQLVRCLSDPRNTNRAHFRKNLELDEGLVGDFLWVKKLGDAIYGEVAQYKWKNGRDFQDVAVKCRSIDKARQALGEENEWTAHLSGRNVPNPEDAFAEIGILQYLSKQSDLPAYLLKSMAAFTHNSNIWLVTELAEGGELLDAVLSGRVDEPQRRQYTWQMLQAVKYLHAHGIGHRDISLENVLLQGDSIRLMDFGNAVQSHSATGQELRYFLAVGKDTYRAPECFVPRQPDARVTVPAAARPGDIIMHRGYEGIWQVRLPSSATPGQACQAENWGYAVQPADVFSCGICLFCMSYGNGPWVTAQLSDEFFAYVYKNQQNGLKDLLRHWQKPLCDSEAMELILSMLNVDPLSRPSADKCLQSGWLMQMAHSSRTKGAGSPAFEMEVGHAEIGSLTLLTQGAGKTGRKHRRKKTQPGSPTQAKSSEQATRAARPPLSLKAAAWKLPGCYDVRGRIGTGSYGTVREALDKDAGRMVAVKRIHSVFSNKINCKRILREIAILQRLDHPYIVQLHDVIMPQDEERFDELYMVMELGDADLKTLCRQQVHLEELQVKFVLYHLLVGLKYLHSAGIYHRDLKPSNVLVNQDCNVKICDFGLARAVGEELDEDQDEHSDKAVRVMTQHVVTRYYRAPELILLDDYTEAIDLWSVGCIAFELAEMMEPKPAEDRGPLFPGSTCYPLSPDCQHRHDVAFHSSGCKEQLNMIFEVIGTPSERDVKLLREDARKYVCCFQPRLGCGVQPRLPSAAPSLVETIDSLLRFNPQERATVEEVLLRPLFAEIRDPGKEVVARGYITLEFDQEPDLSEPQLRQCFKQEIQSFRRAGAAGPELAAEVRRATIDSPEVWQAAGDIEHTGFCVADKREQQRLLHAWSLDANPSRHVKFCFGFSCEADMQWRARIGSEEFWATFPPLSPRPEVGSGGLVPIRLNASLRTIVGARPGPEQVQVAGEKRVAQQSCRSTGSSFAPALADVDRKSSRVSSKMSSRAAAELVLDAGSAVGARELKAELHQERLLRQRAEDEAQKLRARLQD